MWCNDWHARLKCVRSLVRAPVGTLKLIFVAKHTALRRKSKEFLARNQDNVSEFGNTSTRGFIFQ
jgi:hypothetical protein